MRDFQSERQQRLSTFESVITPEPVRSRGRMVACYAKICASELSVLGNPERRVVNLYELVFSIDKE